MNATGDLHCFLFISWKMFKDSLDALRSYDFVLRTQSHNPLQFQVKLAFHVCFSLVSLWSCCFRAKRSVFQRLRRVSWSGRKARYLEGVRTHMASTEEAVKSENSSAQPGNPTETAKPAQPVATNPVTSTGAVKVIKVFQFLSYFFFFSTAQTKLHSYVLISLKNCSALGLMSTSR